MIEALRSWIINICAAVIFIAAVELILPDNKIKKYAKFVMGLILITVVLNPILQVLSFGAGNLSTYTLKANQLMQSKSTEVNYNQYKENNIKNTLNTFKTNLEISCVKELKDKFPKGSFEVAVDVEYNDSDNSIDIKAVKLGIKDNSVEKIKKVEITTDNNENSTKDEFRQKNIAVVQFLSKLLSVSEEIISVHKL